jgi:hypothetical protein
VAAGFGKVATTTAPDADLWTVRCTGGHTCSIESVEAADETGRHTVDSIKLPGSGPFLTGLGLSGDR